MADPLIALAEFIKRAQELGRLAHRQTSTGYSDTRWPEAEELSHQAANNMRTAIDAANSGDYYSAGQAMGRTNEQFQRLGDLANRASQDAPPLRSGATAPGTSSQSGEVLRDKAQGVYETSEEWSRGLDSLRDQHAVIRRDIRFQAREAGALGDFDDGFNSGVQDADSAIQQGLPVTPHKEISVGLNVPGGLLGASLIAGLGAIGIAVLGVGWQLFDWFGSDDNPFDPAAIAAPTCGEDEDPEFGCSLTEDKTPLAGAEEACSASAVCAQAGCAWLPVMGNPPWYYGCYILDDSGDPRRVVCNYVDQRAGFFDGSHEWLLRC